MGSGDKAVGNKPPVGEESGESPEREDTHRSEESEVPSGDKPKEERARRSGFLRGPGTVSGKFLFVIVAFVAAAVLTLWAAPRIARVLPSGLEPVAAWLSPGQSEATARIDSLEKDIRDRLTGIEERLAAIEGSTGQLVSDAEAALMLSGYDDFVESRLESVRDMLSAEGNDDLATRIDSVESRLDVIVSDQSILRELVEVGGGPESSAVSSEVLGRIAGYQTELAGLRNDLADVANRQGDAMNRIGDLASRLDDMEDTLAALDSGTSGAGSVQLAELDDIRLALASGDAFSHAANSLAGRPGIEVPPALSDIAASGTPPVAELRHRFPEAAYGAIQATVLAETGDGLAERSIAFLRSLVVTRSLEPREGNDVDAILSRMEAQLDLGDLEGVLREGLSLPENASVSMADWLADVRRLNAAFVALDGFSGSGRAKVNN
ncbi:MAG: mitofilin family membrane protein [Rhodobacteraceae bacterium]|nr:mitofilin family membrane protein [Paracoccaceae bacterium]